MYWFLFILTCIVISLPVTFIKKYTITKSPYWIFLALLLYLFLTILYTQLLKGEDLSYIYTLLSIVSILTVVIFGIFFYGDKVDIYQTFGIILSLVSIILFYISKRKST